MFGDFLSLEEILAGVSYSCEAERECFTTRKDDPAFDAARGWFLLARKAGLALRRRSA